MQLCYCASLDYNRKIRDAKIALNNESQKGEGPVLKGDPKGLYVGRRDFIKTTTMASVAASLPVTRLVGQDTESPSKSKPNRTKKKLLCLSDPVALHERLIESIKSLPGTDLLVSQIKVNYQKPQEIIQSIRGQDVDILLMCLPRFTFNFGSLYDSMGDLNAPIIVLSSNPELILIDANLAASLRANGANVTFALSEAQALELLRNAASTRILEDKRALLYGRPFDSTTVPAHNLTEDSVYKRTGVRTQYRPMAELAELLKSVDEAGARSEMERWKKEAVEIIRVSDKAILDACRLYILLRSIIDKEGLSAISIDCLSFTMSPNPILPYPCLAFARLRDEGITAACEADLCGMLSSMFLQEISRRPSFMCNVMSVDLRKSSIVLSHCVAPLKLNGSNAAPMRYRLHDYHGFGRGVVPEVEFPEGMEVTTGAFSKNLKSFSVWPGRIQAQVRNTDRSSAPKGFMLSSCANTMEVKVKDTGRFLQNIAGIHHVMVTGNYTKTIDDALFGMNMGIVGPSDFTAPEL
jgi:L-fucose isomerase-like protein